MELANSFRSCQKKFGFNDDGFFTFTSTEQKRVEDLVSEYMNKSVSGDQMGIPVLYREKHIEYITKSLKEVGKGYMTLDASRTWMCFWGVHSLNVLGAAISHSQKQDIINFIKTCEHPGGGYGGGPGQYAHLAPTYASVMTLVSLQTEEALKSINLLTMREFLLRMKKDDGSFTMHDGGEADMRGAYCALAVAAICGLLNSKLKDGAAEWIISCQTYEGGFGGEPSTEAHGGYAYCAVTSLVILDRYRLADMEALIKWLTRRQMRFEGGFQGRTNKLVDGCYSFWQAAVFPLIDGEMAREHRQLTDGLFDARMLEEYILMCCQDNTGGLRDKPDKCRDLYHTCYVLSGLSVAQLYSSTRDGVLGGKQNIVEAINPLFNVTTLSEQFAASFFVKQ